MPSAFTSKIYKKKNCDDAGKSTTRTIHARNDTCVILNREYRCGIGQIPFENQVRTSYNSKVLERDQLCILWLVRVLEFLQQQRVDLSLLDQKYLPFRSFFGRILRDPFLIGIFLGITKRGEQDISLYTQSQVASNHLSRSSTYPTPSALTSSASWWRQPLSTTCKVLPKFLFVDEYQ